MKRILFTSRCREDVLHIETDLGIINISIGLTDRFGRKVEHISIQPDHYAGEQKVKATPVRCVRMIQLKKKVGRK